MAVAAPWAGVLIKGAEQDIGKRVDQACIVIMFVLTIPGSEAFMVMSLSCSRSANSWDEQ